MDTTKLTREEALRRWNASKETNKLVRSFLSRLTSLISSLISSRVISGNSPLSAIALISANAAFALAVTSSSSCRAFCGLSFRMVSDVCTIAYHY